MLKSLAVSLKTALYAVLVVHSCLKLKRIVNSFGEPKEIIHTIDGRKVTSSFKVADDNLEVTFSETIKAREEEN